jgi:hypothetical protein
MTTIVWKKASGTLIETNDEKATIAAAKAAGWKKAKGAEPKVDEPESLQENLRRRISGAE